MHRLLMLIAAVCVVAGCTNPNDLDEAPVELGNFALGHNVVVAPNITKGPASRDATPEEWIASMTSAIDERFSRFEGEKLYHLGISVEGYVLAVPGIPLVASPKSALIIRVTAWDDAAGAKLNEEPEQITIVESISANTFLSSGLTQSKEVQMENLSRNAAKLIQNWLVRENAKNDWFNDPVTEGAAPAEGTNVDETGPEAAEDASEDTAEELVEDIASDAPEEVAEAVLEDS